jgi:phage tail sheath gpL-like
MVPVIKGYADDAWSYQTGHAPLVVTGFSGDVSAAIAAARSFNHRHVAMAWSEHVQSAVGVWDAARTARSHSFEVAAAVASRLFSQTKVNANYNGASLPCYGRADNMARATLNEAISAGITVVVQPTIGDEPGRIVDPVVTMSTDANGAPDTEWQPVECVRVVAEITRQLGAELAGFPRMDGDDDTRASAKSAALAVLREAAREKLIEAPADDHVDVAYETVNGARRLIVGVSYGVIVGLDIVEVTHNISRA